MAANSPIPQSLLSPPTAQEENSRIVSTITWRTGMWRWVWSCLCHFVLFFNVDREGRVQRVKVS